MVDPNYNWSESFAKHAQPSFIVEIPADFVTLLTEGQTVSEFVLRAQNGMFNKSNPEVVDVLSNIQRHLTQMDQTAFVEILQQSDNQTVSPTNRNRTRGYKCESTIQVCQLLSSYLTQKRRAVANTASGSGRIETETENESLHLILRPWLDIDSGCEFRIFIIGVHIHAIFQRKGGPAQTNQMAKKVFRMMLMSFLRTAQLEDAHLSEYMVDAFIAPDRKVWVLDIKSLKDAKKPTPGGWSELSLASRVGSEGSAGSGTNGGSSGSSASNSATTSPMVSPTAHVPPVTLPNDVNSMGVVYSNKSFDKHRLECVSSDANNVMKGVAIHGSASNVGSSSNLGTPVISMRKGMNNTSSNTSSMPTPPASGYTTYASNTSNNSASITYASNTSTTNYHTAPPSPEPLRISTTSMNTSMNSSKSSTSSISDRKGISLHVEVPTTPRHHHIDNLATPHTPYSPAFPPTPNSTTPKSNTADTPITPIHTSTLTPTSTPTTSTPTDMLSPVNITLNDDATHTIPPYLMEKYKLGPVLGKGAYANVREGTDKETGKQVAVKILHRGSFKTTAEVSVKREVHILSMLNHPNIVRTYAFYEEPEYFYTVLECIQGGALFDRIKTRKLFTEREVRELAVVLLGAVKHCHDHHVVHRDLKPENLLMTSADNNQDLKIVDFGFAAIDTGGCVLTDRCGTPMYVAPEILQKIPHGKPVDMWSFGVILFLLLSGDAPFKDPNVKLLYPKIKNGSYHFKSNWKDISPLAADLVKQLLVVPQLDRLTVDQALGHAWFKVGDEELPTLHLSTVVEGLRSFQAAQRFRKGVNAVKALNRMKIKHQLTRTEYIEAANKLPKEVDARYVRGDVLGRGGYATVYAAVSKVDQRNVAIKVIPRAGLKAATELGIRRETEILRHLHHKNIVKSYDFIETEENFNVVLERVDGGELFDRILKKKFYNEAEARDLAVVILKALKHCHEHKVAHRDLKPENLLMTGSTESADLKLVDFGFAAKCDGFSLTNQCGTPAYVAPEIIRKHPHGLPVDMWSFGVILYILLCGYPPFRDKVEKQLFLKIRAGVYEFHPKYWDKVSEDAKDLIRKLLVIDPVNRLTVEQALSHPWIHADGKMLSSYDLSESLSEMELFQNNKQFKVGVNVILAIHKMSKSRLMRSNSMGSVSGSESNTPVGSPMPANNNTGSSTSSGTNTSAGGTSGGVERTLSVNIHAPGVNSVYAAGGPVSPKSGNSGVTSTFTSNKRMANLLFSAAAKASVSSGGVSSGGTTGGAGTGSALSPRRGEADHSAGSVSPRRVEGASGSNSVGTSVKSTTNATTAPNTTTSAASSNSPVPTPTKASITTNTTTYLTTTTSTNNTTGGIAIDTGYSSDSVAHSTSTYDNIYDISPMNSPRNTSYTTPNTSNNTGGSTPTTIKHATIAPFSPQPAGKGSHFTFNTEHTQPTTRTTNKTTTVKNTNNDTSARGITINTAASPKNTQLVELMKTLHLENTSFDF